MYRVENKYDLSPMDMWELEKRIAAVMEPDPHNVDGKGYTISSVYFDDIYDTCLQETLAGNAQRSKYRARIYNDSFDFIQLEVKSKTYNWTLKHSSTITRDELDLVMQGIPLENATDILEDPRCAFNTMIRTRLLAPRVIVTYDRNAYICSAGNVRITFDRNLRGSTQTDHFGDPGLIYDYPAEHQNVLEVKYDEYIPDYILQLLQTDTMLRINNSKYAVCRELYR